MSLSSKKSNAYYNRAAQKDSANKEIDEHFTYDPNEWYQDSCDHHTCTYCNPPLEEVHRNRIIYILWKLKVLNNQQLDELMYY